MPLAETIALAAAKKAGSLVGSKVFAALKERSQERHRAKLERAFTDLMDQVAVLTNTDPEGAEARMDELLQEATPDTEEALLEHFRTSVEALDPAAHRPIAKLSAWYLTERKPRDAFFRRIGRMLIDATADEIAQLQQMFSLAREAIGPAGLAAGEWIRLGSDRHPNASLAFASIKKGDRTVRQLNREGMLINQGMEALRRSLILPDLVNASQVDFGVQEHDLLARLIRVFA